MKTTFIPIVGLALSSMLLTHRPFAQFTASGNSHLGQVAYNSIKITDPPINGSHRKKLPVTIPYNRKVLARFNKQFLNISDVNWSVEPQGSWHVTFTKDGDFNFISFNKKGGIIYQANYLPEKKLPSDLKQLVTDSYTEYQITGAIKIQKDDRTIWFVNLTSLNHIVQLRVIDGQMEQVYIFERSH